MKSVKALEYLVFGTAIVLVFFVMALMISANTIQTQQNLLKECDNKLVDAWDEKAQYKLDGSFSFNHYAYAHSLFFTMGITDTTSQIFSREYYNIAQTYGDANTTAMIMELNDLMLNLRTAKNKADRNSAYEETLAEAINIKKGEIDDRLFFVLAPRYPELMKIWRIDANGNYISPK